MDDPLEWFTDLYDQCYRRVLRYALLNTDHGSAEDVTSEVFLIAWRQRTDVPEPPLPWLLGVARNLLRREARAGQRRQLLADRIATLGSEDDFLAWDAGEHAIARASAVAALASLPPADAEVLTLVTWHGLDVREAAAVSGCTPRAFTMRLHRARRRLTRALQAPDREPASVDRRPAPACQRYASPLRQSAAVSKEQG